MRLTRKYYEIYQDFFCKKFYVATCKAERMKKLHGSRVTHGEEEWVYTVQVEQWWTC